VAGVDEQCPEARRLHQPQVDLVGSELCSRPQVGVRIGTRLEPEQRCAVREHGEADGGVEVAQPARRRSAAFVEEQLEGRAVERVVDHPVHMMVDEQAGAH
jgi:hypothetical protein